MSKADLGCYGLAFVMVSFAVQFLRQISGKILLPVYARNFGADGLPVDSIQKLKRLRVLLGCAALIPIYTLAIFSNEIVAVIYPSDYAEVAWMVRTLAIGASITCLAATLTPILLAAGDSFGNMLLTIFHVVIRFFLSITLGILYGSKAMIVGFALSEAACFPLLLSFVNKHQRLYSVFDLIVVLTSAGMCVWFLM